ncbi:MAG: SufD family Fe-S cluster assembly protein [Dehalococcoidia bacterium]|nr:SufD family Fe-S cluster assembly protein [Dehalococcoidia bacterium]
MVDAASTTATTGSGAYAEAQVSADALGRGEPAWLVRSREEAARAFAATPMPTPALRPWKYTELSGLDIESFAPDAAFAPLVIASVPTGGFAGSIAGALDDAAQAGAVEAAFGSVVQGTEGKFVAANAARWSGGVFVHALRGGVFATPVTVDVRAGGGAIFPRMLVIAEANSEVTIIVRNRSTAAPLLVAGVVEIVAAEGARVRLLLDGDWGAATDEFTTVRSRVGRNADVQVASLAIGGHMQKQHIEALIEGEGANSLIRGIALGDGDQHFDFVTLQDHMGAKSTSDVEIKSALAGASRSVYYGVTRVETTAKGAAANQQNRNLLLSDHAKADSDPVLEILTSDVIRCGHGATVGPVDGEALFYLQSRGLDRRSALKLLVAGFFASVLGDAAFAALADDMQERVERKLAVAAL